jgi:hypothetical protein
MNKFAKPNTVKKSISIILLFGFVLLSNAKVFSQTTVSTFVITNTEVTDGISKQENVKNSSIEFVLWFMGSKQNPNSTISTEGINTKKQIITSGMAPNRLLIKAFLKKAVNFESAIA